MLSKRLLAIFILSLFLINFLALTLIHAQESPPGLPSELENPDETIENIKNKTETKWDYLGREWKNILQKNKIVAAIDSFFTKIDNIEIFSGKFSIFRFLFNTPYSFSITVIVIILIWIFFAFESGRWLQKWLGGDNLTFLVIGAGISVILSHIGFILLITRGLGWLVTAKKEWWYHLIMIVVSILIFVFIYYCGEYVAKMLDERAKKKKEEETKQKQKEIKAFAKGLEKGAGI